MRGFRSRVQDASGVEFDVGETKAVTEASDELGLGDGREPAELLARILAHVGHRLPGVRRVERRLEGQELGSGLLSDLLALGAQLAQRNRERLPGILESLNARRAAAAARREAKAPGPAQGTAETNNGAAAPEAVTEVIRP